MVCVNQQITPMIGISAVFNIIGHSVIMLTVWHCYELHTKCHVILGNLSLSDMLMGATLLPLVLLARLFENDEEKCHILRTAAEMIEYTALNCSILNLILLTADRYMACVHGFRYSHISMKTVKHTLATFWFISALMSALCLIEQPSDRLAPTIIRERFSSDIMHVTLVFSGFLFIAISQITLYRMSSAYLSSTIRETRRLHGEKAELYDLIFKQRKATIVVVAMTLAFAFCYIPMAVLKVLRFLDYRTSAVMVAERVCAALIPLNGAINPFIYGLSSQSLRKAIGRKIVRITQRNAHGNRVIPVSSLNRLNTHGHE